MRWGRHRRRQRAGRAEWSLDPPDAKGPDADTHAPRPPVASVASPACRARRMIGGSRRLRCW